MFARLILKIIGWKIKCDIDINSVPQAVIMAGPHTSNWDFFYTIFGTRAMGVKIKFLIKDSFFVFPLNMVMSSLGGIPVDRSKKNSLVDQVIEKINKKEINYLIVSPEGTRSRTDKWKSGFYHIARNSKVPLVIGYIDYEKKVVGIEKEFVTTGNFELDLQEMQKFYSTITPLFKENSNLH